jgi:putative DNA primase/helicase
MSSLPEDDLSLIAEPMSELTPRPVEWLWPWRLGFGKLSMLDGDPDRGKSLVALDLCARLSKGAEMPDGSPGPGPTSSLILNAEDSGEDTILPRLKAMGADLSRIFRVRQRGDGWRPISFPTHTAALDRLLGETGARMVVIDTVLAFLDRNIDANCGQAVRRALAPLNHLAEQHRAHVQMPRHLNKWGGRLALYRGTGSIALAGACHSVWLVGRDPGEPQRRVVAEVRNKQAPPQPSLAYRVETGEGGSPTVRWVGRSPWSADQLLSGSPRPSPGVPLAVAQEFLTSFLKEGPRTTHELWAAAQERGLSVSTLNRAKAELSVRSQRVHRDGVQRSYWLLPWQHLPSGNPQWDAAVEAMRKYCPPRVPIDEVEE